MLVLCFLHFFHKHYMSWMFVLCHISLVHLYLSQTPHVIDFYVLSIWSCASVLIYKCHMSSTPVFPHVGCVWSHFITNITRYHPARFGHIILSYYHTVILSFYHAIILSYYHTIIILPGLARVGGVWPARFARSQDWETFIFFIPFDVGNILKISVGKNLLGKFWTSVENVSWENFSWENFSVGKIWLGKFSLCDLGNFVALTCVKPLFV